MNEEKRCCENCGRTECSNSYIAFHWDECVESNFEKWWKPKETAKEKKELDK